jgi:lipid A ethanolaminephosphotransferase
MLLRRWRPAVDTLKFVALASTLNALLYHVPLLRFAAGALDLASLSGVLTLLTLLIAVLATTAIVLCFLAALSPRLLRPVGMLLATGNAIALYFVMTYGVVLDKTMMGNVHDTDFGEVAELLTPRLLAYLLILGGVPVLLLARVRVEPVPRLRAAAAGVAVLFATVAWAYVNAGTWLWFDHHARKLGGLVMPWSYVVNAVRHELPRLRRAEPVALPAATFRSDDRTVVVLVIGEAARRRNLQLYGYGRPTTPELARAGVVAVPNATACSTYTTASVRCILSHADSGSEFSTRHEPLPAYLQRHGVDVIWRTRNWGEPRMRLQAFERARDLKAGCDGAGCDFDEVLLTGLGHRIRESPDSRVFVVLHLMGSHGPAYSARYPPAFETFTPACKSVELGRCSAESLVNAYDNTILYTDHVLGAAITLLKQLGDRPSVLIYVSDHGESLGEYGLYLHGTPWSLAPDVQREVPFLLWLSPAFARRHHIAADRLGPDARHGQREVFHTVMGALDMRSGIYVPELDLFGDGPPAR